MPGIKYRLTYFPFKGRGELVRLLFHAARVPFEDRHVDHADWPDLKPQTPSGTLPMLEINGEKFEDSVAIVLWAANKFGLMGKTDAEALKTYAILAQATELRENSIGPFSSEKDPEKIEVLKKRLEESINKLFPRWEANVVQTESTGRKVFSYMVTQSMTAADLALVYLADLAQDYISLDWSPFPRLQAVVHTVSDLPHIRAYLNSRDNPQHNSSSKPPHSTPRPQPHTTTAPASQKQPASSSYKKSVGTPRAKGSQPVKQA